MSKKIKGKSGDLHNLMSEINKSISDKSFFIEIWNSDALEPKMQEYTDHILDAFKNVLDCNVSVLNPKYFTIEFEKITNVAYITDMLKAALFDRFDGGKLEKVTIRNLCVTFFEDLFLTISIRNMNSWKLS